MNADRLLEHFDRISDAPDAVPRLRRFVLDLAVRGRLVPQDESEKAAPAILAVNDEDHVPTDSRGRGTRYLETENERFPIPRCWIWTRLGAVGDWGSGTTPSRGNADYFDGNVSWFKSGELNDNQSLVGSEEQVTSLAIEQCSFRRNAPGDVLFAMYGATIGKVAILAEPAVTNQAVVACTPCEHLFNRYLFLFLLSQRQRFHEASEGGAQPNVSKAKVIRCPMPLPPLAEQHRIVAKVDELMAHCDRLEAAQAVRETRRDRLVSASLARVTEPASQDPASARTSARFHLDHFARLTTRPEHVKQLRQTILNLAVRGRLVPQDSLDAPIDLTLGSLQDDGRSTTPAATEVKEQSANFPQGWRLSTLGEACERIHYGYTASADKTKKDVRLLRITDIQDNAVNWATVPGCVISPEEIPKYTLGPGDILVARTGGTIGKTFLVETVPVTAVFASYLIRLQPKRCMDARFTKLFMESPQYWDQLRDGARGAGQPNVNSKTLGAMSFHLPPLAEQRRIVAKVDELMALCDQLEASLASAATDRARLLVAMLRDALVPAV